MSIDKLYSGLRFVANNVSPIIVGAYCADKLIEWWIPFHPLFPVITFSPADDSRAKIRENLGAYKRHNCIRLSAGLVGAGSLFFIFRRILR